MALALAVMAAASRSPPKEVAALTPTPAGPQTAAASPAGGEGTGLDKAGNPPPRCEAPFRLNRKSRLLQHKLEQELAHKRLNRYTRKHQLAVALVDVTRPDDIYYAGINDDEMMYAASLPKIAILLTVAEEVKDGGLNWNPEYEGRLASMITESSNPQAAWAATLVGLEAIERTMRNPRYCLYDNVHGGLWVGKPYGPGEEHRDPLKDLSHAATARQAARFYTMLNNEDLVSQEWSRHLLKLMGPPKHHHKFVAGLSNRKGVSFIARKSGTWRNWHCDSALIQHNDQRYVAVALSELRNGEEVMHQVIQVLDDLVTDGSHRRPRKFRR